MRGYAVGTRDGTKMDEDGRGRVDEYAEREER
jgi:hypothetical protein